MPAKRTIDRDMVRQLWFTEMDLAHIAIKVGCSLRALGQISDDMGLPARRPGRKVPRGEEGRIALRAIRASYKTVIADLMRRHRCRQPSPINLALTTPIGPPIRVIEPNTRALIDAAMDSRP